MNRRIYKKKLKNRFHIKTIPKGVEVKWLNKFLMEFQNMFRRKLEEKIDDAILYGIKEQEHE